MSYQIKDEDLQKGITLQLTAEQLDIIAGALESVCISLGETNDPYLGYVAEAQEAIIDVLESHFGEHIIAAFEASQFFKLKQMIVDCKEKNHSPLRTVFINLQGEPNESAKQIGRELNHVGGLKSMQGVADTLLVFCKNEGYSTSDVRELECCWDGIGEWCA